MPVRYSERFKEKMVQKMAGPNGRSATCLAEEVGISQPTLSRWLKGAGTVPAMAKKKSTKKRTRVSQPQRPERRPQDWAPIRKLEVVLEAATLSKSRVRTGDGCGNVAGVSAKATKQVGAVSDHR